MKICSISNHVFKVWPSISTKLWSQTVKSINKLRAFETFLKAHSEHWNDFSFDVSNHCEVLKQSTSKFSANRLENYLESLWLQEEKRKELLIVMTSFSYRSKQKTASLKMKVMNLLRRRTPSTGITKSWLQLKFSFSSLAVLRQSRRLWWCAAENMRWIKDFRKRWDKNLMMKLLR